jgi:DNA-binding SARP family transcriptional activator
MTKLVVRLLGGFRVELDGEVVYDFETDKARALLAYLVVEADRPHRRETLAGLLWPDWPDTVARGRLRQTLFRVRQALTGRGSPANPALDPAPTPFLLVTPTDVQFNTASDYSLDVADLEAFARDCGARPPARCELLQAALCADFLAGFSVPDSEAFESWVLSKQEQCHRLAIETLDAQSATFEGSGDYERVVVAARLQLQLEPWLEEAHRRLMRGLALAGRRNEALHQYEACRRALRAELGAEPDAATQALHAEIRAGKLVAAAHPSRPVRRETEQIPDRSRRPVRSSSRLVARAEELGQLNRHLQAALAGETGIAFVSGDAGSGKTALLEGFAASAVADHPQLLVAGARCNPGGSLDTCAPLRRLAEMLFGDLSSETAWWLHGGAQPGRLRDSTPLLLSALAEHGPGLVEALVPAASIARRAGRSTLRAAVDRKPVSTPLSKGVLFDQLVRTLAAISRQQPLILLFDDLHWVDEASADFLLHLGRELGSARLLVLGAYRSKTIALGRRDARSGETFRHPLAAVVNELRLQKGEILIELDRADGRAFVEAYVDTEPNRLGAGFRDALYAQTGGHALFTVESLRNLQARGELVKDEAGRWVARESLDWGALPARVEAVIAERIERLPEVERRILSVASVQGDDFTGEVVAELIGATVAEVLFRLSGSLARQHSLVRAEGVVRAEGPLSLAEPERLGNGQRSIYCFAHHLFQKYLYDQLDPVERAGLHGAVAAVLDRQAGFDPVQRRRLGARLAWHYESAGLPLQAARALLDAGHQAMRVSAFREALDMFDRGLALLGQAGERPTGEAAEIRRLIEVARLGPQRNLAGLGSASLQGGLARAAAAWAGAPAGEAQGRPMLMMIAAETERLFAAGQFEHGLDAAERMRDLASQSGEEGFAALAHHRLGNLYHCMGDLREAESHFGWVRDWLTPERAAEARAEAGHDVAASSLAFSALNQWFLGYPQQALARSSEAITGAIERGDLYAQACASALGSTLLFFLRDKAALQERSEQSYRLCLQGGFAMWQAYAEVFLGWLAVLRGEGAAGIEQMRRALSEWQATGMAVGTDSLVPVLANGCLAAARECPAREDTVRLLATGLAAIDPVLGADVPCGQCYQAELHRLRGELLLARDGLAASAEALVCFQRALQLGREQGALAWELRAAMSLVRLRERHHGPPSEAAWEGQAFAAALVGARRCLADVYARYTEGFAFPDLQEAAGLIGNLEPSATWDHPRQEIGELA